MRLMGSFHTMTSHGSSGWTTRSPSGRSPSTGSCAPARMLIPLFSQGGPGPGAATLPQQVGDLGHGRSEVVILGGEDPGHPHAPELLRVLIRDDPANHHPDSPGIDPF